MESIPVALEIIWLISIALHPIEIVPSNIHPQINFVARKDLPIESIEKLCEENYRIILNGMAGVGKSELAKQYLFHSLEKRKYRAYIWVRAESEESLSNEYALIAKTLGLVSNDETNFDIILNALLKELNSVDEWLMVFDNLDKMDSLHDRLPRQKGTRHVIITTRYGQTSRSFQAKLEYIPELSSLESLSLFNSIYPCNSKNMQEASARQDLMVELGNLPLAILQSTAYLTEEPMSVSEYLTNYQKTYDESIWTYRPVEDKTYEPVGVTLTMTLDRIKDSEIAL